jgi:NAD-dependent DNA ligase
MSIHREWINEPKMDATFENLARKWVIDLEDAESRDTGQTVREARKVVARKTGVATGTLENIRRGRLKRIGATIADKLQAYMVRNLQSEIAKKQNDLEMVLRCRGGASGNEVAELRAAIARAQSLVDQVVVK